MGDKKLGTIGARSGIGHGQDSRSGKFQRRIKFVCKGVARASSAGTQRAAALDHKIIYYPMKLEAIVKTSPCGFVCTTIGLGAFAQADKVDNRERALVVIELKQDVTLIRSYFCIQAVFHFLFLSFLC